MFPSPRSLIATLILLLAASGLRADSFFVATAYYRQGQWKKALEVIEEREQGEGKQSIPPYLQFIKGSCLQQLERQREAIVAFDELLERFPTSTYALNGRSQIIQILESQGDLELLISKLKGWIEKKSPGSDKLVLDLARAYTAQQKPDEAIAHLATLDLPEAIDALFTLLQQENRFKKYIEEQEKTAGNDPAKAKLIGALAVKAKDWERARKHLEIYLSANPEDLVTLDQLATLARDTGHLAEARGYAERLVARDPASPTYLRLLGSLELHLGDKAKAIATWNRIIAAAPHEPQQHLLLSRIYKDHRLLEEAIQVLVNARQSLSRPDLFAGTLGELHQELGHHEDAAREFLNAYMAGDEEGQYSGRVLEMAKGSPEVRTAVLAALRKVRQEQSHFLPLYRLEDDILNAPRDVTGITRLIAELVQAQGDQQSNLLHLARELAAADRILEARLIVSALLPKLPTPHVWEFGLDLARLHRLEGDAPRALELALGLDRPDVESPFRLRALELAGKILLYDLYQVERARDIFEGLATENPASPRTPQFLLHLARAQLAIMDTAKAVEILGRIPEETPEGVGPKVLYEKARLHLLAGKVPDAQQLLRDLVQRSPDDATANEAVDLLFFLGSRAGLDPQALKEYFIQDISLEFGRTQQFDESRARIDTSRLPPEVKGDFLLLSARRIRLAGEKDKALAVLEEIVAASGSGPALREALLLKAEILEKDLGKAKEAVETLKEFLLLYPTDMEAENVRKRIAGDTTVSPGKPRDAAP